VRRGCDGIDAGLSHYGSLFTESYALEAISKMPNSIVW
jgi:hypothetical protein